MFEEDITKIYNKVKHLHTGKNADYIPELAKVNPNLYAISICTIDGYCYNIGDFNTEFAIESCSKIFKYLFFYYIYGIIQYFLLCLCDGSNVCILYFTSIYFNAFLQQQSSLLQNKYFLYL